MNTQGWYIGITAASQAIRKQKTGEKKNPQTPCN